LLAQWGVAYELAGTQAQQAKTLKYLEWREKQVTGRQWREEGGACLKLVPRVPFHLAALESEGVLWPLFGATAANNGGRPRGMPRWDGPA